MEHVNGKLVKIDRNGSKHYEGLITCDRCQGRGDYWWGAMINGRPQYSGVCFKCGGTGKVRGKWIERTPEYQAKLDAQREARQSRRQAEIEAEAARREAERVKREAEREERLRALRAVSQHVGKIGQRITTQVTYAHGACFEVKSFSGFGTDTRYIHTFKDADGNVLIWKTGTDIRYEYGAQLTLTGTVKEHSTYRDEKQTVLAQCKIAE